MCTLIGLLKIPVLNLVLCLVLYTCFAFYCISVVLRDRCWFCCSVMTATVINEHYYYYYYCENKMVHFLLSWYVLFYFAQPTGSQQWTDAEARCLKYLRGIHMGINNLKNNICYQLSRRNDEICPQKWSSKFRLKIDAYQ